MTTKEALIAARALVEKGWCQAADARDAGGLECASRDAEAACWCLSGAIHRACDGLAEDDAWDVLASLVGDPVEWNDTPGRSKEEVLALFDKAIEAQP